MNFKKILKKLRYIFKLIEIFFFFFLFIYCHREQSPFREHISKGLVGLVREPSFWPVEIFIRQPGSNRVSRSNIVINDAEAGPAPQPARTTRLPLIENTCSKIFKYFLTSLRDPKIMLRDPSFPASIFPSNYNLQAFKTECTNTYASTLSLDQLSLLFENARAFRDPQGLHLTGAFDFIIKKK